MLSSQEESNFALKTFEGEPLERKTEIDSLLDNLKENMPISKSENEHKGSRSVARVRESIPTAMKQLLTVNKLTICQEDRLMEVLDGYEQENKYSIRKPNGEILFYAVEEGDRSLASKIKCKPIEIAIMDSAKNHLMRFTQPFSCNCWNFGYESSIEVYAPPGWLIGTVKQKWSFSRPLFAVNNAKGDLVLWIEGENGNDMKTFTILSKDKINVGVISDLRQCIQSTEGKCLCLTFHGDVDVYMKACMLGACFLIG